MQNLLNNIKASRKLLISISEEFIEAANEEAISVQVQTELEAIRRRAAVRLIPSPKMGYEHLYFLKLSSRIEE